MKRRIVTAAALALQGLPHEKVSIAKQPIYLLDAVLRRTTGSRRVAFATRRNGQGSCRRRACGRIAERQNSLRTHVVYANRGNEDMDVRSGKTLRQLGLRHVLKLGFHSETPRRVTGGAVSPAGQVLVIPVSNIAIS